jgi:two-component system response regulator YesN
VITGYEEFEYARRAVELGVNAYLLKPVELSALRAALDAAIQQMLEERERERHFAWAMSRLEKRRDSLREEFLSELIRGNLTREEGLDHRHLLGFPELSRPVLLMIRAVRTPGSTGARRSCSSPLPTRSGRAVPLRFSWVFGDEGPRHGALRRGPGDGRNGSCSRAPRRRAAEGVRRRLPGGGRDLDAWTRCTTRFSRPWSGRPPAPRVEQATRYIHENYARSDLGLQDVPTPWASTVLSERLMKQELGMPFSKYLTAVRVGAAVEIMHGGGVKIREVARRVGYSTPHYFSTAFKKVLGAPPAEYRDEETGR